MMPRSYLFVPGDRPERFLKALSSGADAIVLDLEDAVVPEHKIKARQHVAHWLAQRDASSMDRVVVRINDASTRWFEDDARMLAQCRVRLAMLPKTESAAAVATLRALAGDQLSVLALIETARGVHRLDELSEAPGVQRLVFGTIDYALDMDLPGDPVGFDHAAARMAIASRANGLASPVAGVTPEIDDAERIRSDWQRARAHGFGAKLCIHPRQVSVVHEAMRPDAAQLAWARRVVEACDGSDGSAVQLDGRMVDKPVLERARTLLRRAD